MNILARTSSKWQLYLWIEITIHSLSAAAIFGSFFDFTAATIACMITVAGLAFVLKPWSKNHTVSARLVNQQVAAMEYSAEFVLREVSQLSPLGKLQREKASHLLEQYARDIKVPFNTARIVIMVLLAALFSWTASFLKVKENFIQEEGLAISTLNIPSDLGTSPVKWPGVERLDIRITPPPYSGKKSYHQADLDLEVMEGAFVQWSLQLDGPLDKIELASANVNTYTLKKGNDQTFTGGAKISKKGFYNFRFIQDTAYLESDLYAINIIMDNPPKLKMRDLASNTVFDHDQTKEIKIQCDVTDDYGIHQAYLVATVSKGSGESVKFREERFLFDNVWEDHRRSLALTKTLDLDKLDMTPGDELYFYAEAVDNKPSPQRARTGTFFVSIRDTTELEFSLAGSLGADVMPEYFRSQRQLIIDTEKLLKDRPSLPKHDFKTRSNVLGYDQKALRIRYGQFMGEEFTTGLAPATEQEETATTGDDHDHAVEEEDPLAGFTHDHDGDNEHNLVAEDHVHHEEDHTHHEHDHAHYEHDHTHHEHEENDGEEDPLHSYQHIHDDPEEATFFTISVRQKLGQALNEMWDAELYLRLYQPKKSLPYQYKALKLLKEIKNHARIYVHRIGFDPPPIKEESRLKGDIDEVQDQIERASWRNEDPYRQMRKALALLERLIQEDLWPSPGEVDLMEAAGSELASLAIEQPGRHLRVLQNLRDLIQQSSPSDQTSKLMRAVRLGLARALPAPKQRPPGMEYQEHDIIPLFREQLEQVKE